MNIQSIKESIKDMTAFVILVVINMVTWELLPVGNIKASGFVVTCLATILILTQHVEHKRQAAKAKEEEKGG